MQRLGRKFAYKAAFIKETWSSPNYTDTLGTSKTQVKCAHDSGERSQETQRPNLPGSTAFEKQV